MSKTCPVCKQEVSSNKLGQILMHTTKGSPGLLRGAGTPAEPCKGATKGARP